MIPGNTLELLSVSSYLAGFSSGRYMSHSISDLAGSTLERMKDGLFLCLTFKPKYIYFHC